MENFNTMNKVFNVNLDELGMLNVFYEKKLVFKGKELSIAFTENRDEGITIHHMDEPDGVVGWFSVTMEPFMYKNNKIAPPNIKCANLGPVSAADILSFLKDSNASYEKLSDTSKINFAMLAKNTKKEMKEMNQGVNIVQSNVGH